MKLYEIDNEIKRILAERVDPETGEIASEAWDELSALQAERTWKLENVALAIKNVSADAKAFREEEKKFSVWRKASERQAERLSEFLARELDGEKLTTERVRVTFRKVNAVDVENPVLATAYLRNQGYTDCIREKEPEIDKAAVKRLLGVGVDVPGIRMEERLSMQVK